MTSSPSVGCIENEGMNGEINEWSGLNEGYESFRTKIYELFRRMQAELVVLTFEGRGQVDPSPKLSAGECYPTGRIGVSKSGLYDATYGKELSLRNNLFFYKFPYPFFFDGTVFIHELYFH